jgi:hypothetical protein
MTRNQPGRGREILLTEPFREPQSPQICRKSSLQVRESWPTAAHGEEDHKLSSSATPHVACPPSCGPRPGDSLEQLSEPGDPDFLVG